MQHVHAQPAHALHDVSCLQPPHSRGPRLRLSPRELQGLGDLPRAARVLGAGSCSEDFFHRREVRLHPGLQDQAARDSAAEGGCSLERLVLAELDQPGTEKHHAARGGGDVEKPSGRPPLSVFAH